MPSPGRQELKALQSRQLDQDAEKWNRYKPGPSDLRPKPLTDDEEEETVLSQDAAQAEQASADNERSDPGSESVSESASDDRPISPDEPMVPEVAEAIGECQLEGRQEASSSRPATC